MHLEVALERLEVHVDLVGAEQRVVRQAVGLAAVAEPEADVEPARARAAVAQLKDGRRGVVDHGGRVLDARCGGEVGHVCEKRRSQCCSRACRGKRASGTH